MWCARHEPCLQAGKGWRWQLWSGRYDQLIPYLKQHSDAIRRAEREFPILAVETDSLGIPTVVDRVIQQAMLIPIFDPDFPNTAMDSDEGEIQKMQ